MILQQLLACSVCFLLEKLITSSAIKFVISFCIIINRFNELSHPVDANFKASSFHWPFILFGHKIRKLKSSNISCEKRSPHHSWRFFEPLCVGVRTAQYFNGKVSCQESSKKFSAFVKRQKQSSKVFSISFLIRNCFLIKLFVFSSAKPEQIRDEHRRTSLRLEAARTFLDIPQRSFRPEFVSSISRFFIIFRFLGLPELKWKTNSGIMIY